MRKHGRNEYIKAVFSRRLENSVKKNLTIDEFSGGRSVDLYEKDLIERARTQWQFGDWQSLAQLEYESIRCNPDRAKLALWASAGLRQIGNDKKARQFIRFALDWGVGKELLYQILVSGIYNSLGRVSLLSGQQKDALKHFQSSIEVAACGADVHLFSQARINQQCVDLGFVSWQKVTSSDKYPFALTSSSSDRSFNVVDLLMMNTP